VSEVGWDEIRARRMARSSLDVRAGRDRLVDVAGAVCGVHAQVQAAAELQIAARLEGAAQGDVRAALWEERTLVKAWTVRGTLHLHPAGDLPLWLAARRAVLDSIDSGLPAWRDPAGVVHPALDAADVEAVRSAVWEVLDGRCLLRDELTAAVVQRVGAGPQERLRSGFAFFLDELCQGPPQGARITLVRPDQWIERWQEVADPQRALQETCRRFLHAYGPARPADFREWCGTAAFRVADAAALFESLGDELEEITVAGHAYFVPAGDRSFPEPGHQVRLLPEYDAYVMGFRERDRLIPQPVRDLIAAHGRGRYEGPAAVRLVLVDGIAAGLWERRRRGKRLELDVRLVRRVRKSHGEELQREAERLGAFLRLEPVLSIDSA
jgi:hypothetical protein